MLKRITKLSRRLGKKKDKQLPPSPSKSEVGNGDSAEQLGNLPEQSSMPDLRVYAIGDNASKMDTLKIVDACNNETMNGDCDLIVPIPLASSEESIIEETSSAEEPDMSIAIDDLQSVYATKHADEDRLFREEMKGIASIASRNATSCEFAKLPQNKEKNRYKNIVTYDQSRVILQRIEDDPFSDYINASYIDGYTKEKKFIATQGPKSKTVCDFWRMIWEQGCVLIVMTTEFRENGKQKCEHYFPEDGAMDYGRIRVESGPVTSYGGYQQRTLKVEYLDDEKAEDVESDDVQDGPQEQAQVRHITHLQCTRWPDHGVPKTTSAIFRLYNKMLELQPPEIDVPILVHCSAGVGRSGTLIALDLLCDQLEAENRVNVHETVINMRKHRTEMVQSLDQYVLLHKLILEKYHLGETDCDVTWLENRIKELEIIDEETEKSGFESEFERLALVPPQNARFGSGSLPHNVTKNKDGKIVPYERSQIFIRMRPTEMRPPYVNASTLLGYDDTVQLIAAQDPLSNTAEDFWRVIIDNYVTCIVMLTSPGNEETESCPQYWPTSDVMEFGDIKIKHEETINHEDYAETTLTILTDDREKLGRSITHLSYCNWEEDQAPPPQGDVTVLELVAQVDKRQRTEDPSTRSKTLVHCSNGAGRSGTFCAIVNIVQRLKCENKVDVFRAIKDLRDCRPCMVKTVGQYRFCHDAIATYLRSFDLYTNGS